MTLRSSHLVVPTEQQPLSQDLVDHADVERYAHLHLFGHSDLCTTAEQSAVSLRHQERTRKHYLLARDDGRPVGAAKVWLPLTDNTAQGMLVLSIDPAADTAAVADLLWGEARQLLVDACRRSVQAWQGHPVPVQPERAGATWLTPATGTGALAEDDLARWLASAGFLLEQVEVHSTLDVAQALPRVFALVEQARSQACPAYRTVSWVGATPQRWRGPMAELRARMSIDAPSGDLDQEEEVWDTARIDQREQQLAEMGTVMVTTIAVEEATGAAVAYSEISHEPRAPTSSVQDDTLVHGAHRGHRLGLWVKAQNLHSLASAVPQVARVHTWNAAENTHMLAINRALGFVAAGTEGGWQWRAEG